MINYRSLTGDFEQDTIDQCLGGDAIGRAFVNKGEEMFIHLPFGRGEADKRGGAPGFPAERAFQIGTQVLDDRPQGTIVVEVETIHACDLCHRGEGPLRAMRQPLSVAGAEASLLEDSDFLSNDSGFEVKFAEPSPLD